MAAILLAALAASMPIAADATASGAAGVFGLPTPVATPEGKARLGFGMDYWRGGDFPLPGRVAGFAQRLPVQLHVFLEDTQRQGEQGQ